MTVVWGKKFYEQASMIQCNLTCKKSQHTSDSLERTALRVEIILKHADVSASSFGWLLMLVCFKIKVPLPGD
jgi:hypothetical protein